ncbi:hypothetical protein KZZ52_01880 [Dactylosporangium sp. AC04546]|uniref:hypothetical protein n=1 Tax=Dactylosporangium sp. AC04546 TaxID=2862460 RepID=UPI001EE03A6D|nr:hypothetical protein [Dactylosporangium sp. AC04546]WVK84208.1 hypothetical protein KZZ52_01880 [Dactylosporangium sp. AC04546]
MIFGIGQSSWLDELQDASTWTDRAPWWAALHNIDLLVALTELQAWLDHDRPYGGQQKSGWVSVVDDLQYAGTLIGPALRDELEPELDVLLSAVSVVPDAFEKDRTAVSTAAGAAASAAVLAVRSKISTSAAAAAAWRDLAADCEASGTEYDLVAHRRDLFWRIVEAAGMNRREVASAVTGIVANRARSVFEARRRVGDTCADWPGPLEQADLEESDRLALCARFIAAPPRVARHVVWVAFDKARLPTDSVAFGAVTFYWGDLIDGLVRAERFTDPRLPAEWRDAGSWFIPVDLAEGADVVYARVDLGLAAIPNAPDKALRMAEGAVALGKFYGGDTRNWTAMHGFLHFQDDRLSGVSPFVAAFEVPERSLNIDYTGAELEARSRTVGAHWTASDGDLSLLVDAVRIWQSVADQQPPAALAQYVQVIEHVAARVDQFAWYDYLQIVLRRRWIRGVIEEDLGNMLLATIHVLDTRSGLAPSAVKSLQARVLERREGEQMVNMVEGLSALPEIGDALSPFTRTARQVRSLLRRLASPAAIADLADSIDEGWGRARVRLQRVRNCIVHGGPVTAAGVGSVQPFARQLAAMSISTCIAGLVGPGIVEEHAERKRAAEDWFAGLRSAPNPTKALYPPLQL